MLNKNRIVLALTVAFLVQSLFLTQHKNKSLAILEEIYFLNKPKSSKEQ